MARAAAGAGKPPVGEQHAALRQLLAVVDLLGGFEHLRHTRPPGTFIADDDDIARADVPLFDGGQGILLTVKGPGGPLVFPQRRRHCRMLDHRALRRQVAVEHGDAALFLIGLFYRM